MLDVFFIFSWALIVCCLIHQFLIKEWQISQIWEIYEIRKVFYVSD